MSIARFDLPVSVPVSASVSAPSVDTGAQPACGLPPVAGMAQPVQVEVPAQAHVPVLSLTQMQARTQAQTQVQTQVKTQAQTQAQTQAHADAHAEAQAQAQLQASESKFRSLVESMDEGFCVIELLFDGQGRAHDCRFIETNPAFAEQTGLSQVQGRCLRELLPTLESVWIDTFGKVARTGRALRFVQHSPALQRWFSVYAAPTGEPGSQRVAVLMTDVSEQKLSELKLQQLATELLAADQRKDRLLATLAHELRNPLAPLRNGLALIRSGAADEALVHVAREMMDRQLTQLTALVSDLLDVARSRSGKLELKRERVLLEPIVRTAVETSLPRIEAAGHQLRLRLPAQPVWLHADRTRVAQVLNNLLDNAAKYTPKRGRIELTARCEGSELVLAVADNGAGLSPQAIGTVFDMFSQGSTAGSHAPGGLGIGLSLVQDLVRLHGGRVVAHSAGPGCGSVFTVHLPLAAEQSTALAAEPVLEHGAEHPAEHLANPANLTMPANPTSPTSPTSPTNPTNPANPTNPTNPPNAANPPNPANAANPADSAYAINVPAARAALPLGRWPAGPAAPSAAQAPRPACWRVLVADDNQDAGESLAMLLQLHGHETEWARDGLQALAKVESLQPDLVILDIGMPGLDGHEVAERLRRMPQHRHLLLVALTGWGADEDRARSRGAGFDLHLTKPANPAALLALMAQPPQRLQQAAPADVGRLKPPSVGSGRS